MSMDCDGSISMLAKVIEMLPADTGTARRIGMRRDMRVRDFTVLDLISLT